MDGIILAEDVTMLIEKGGDYYPFVCATDLAINIEMQTKKVRTDGDGKWNKSRGQSLGYTISLSGVVVFNGTDPHTFDILEYCRQMVHLNFRIVYEDPVANLAKYFIGRALPVNINLPSGSSGFATGTFELEGDGELEIVDALVTCTAEILDAEIGANTLPDPPPPGGIVIRIHDVSSNTARVDYAIDGGGRESIFGVGPGITVVQQVVGNYSGSHTAVLYPVCENGEDGIPYEIDFTR